MGKLFISIDSATKFIMDGNIMGENTTDKNISICLYKCISNIPITLLREYTFNSIFRKMKIEKLISNLK